MIMVSGVPPAKATLGLRVQVVWALGPYFFSWWFSFSGLVFKGFFRLSETFVILGRLDLYGRGLPALSQVCEYDPDRQLQPS